MMTIFRRKVGGIGASLVLLALTGSFLPVSSTTMLTLLVIGFIMMMAGAVSTFVDELKGLGADVEKRLTIAFLLASTDMLVDVIVASGLSAAGQLLSFTVLGQAVSILAIAFTVAGTGILVMGAIFVYSLCKMYRGD